MHYMTGFITYMCYTSCVNMKCIERIYYEYPSHSNMTVAFNVSDIVDFEFKVGFNPPSQSVECHFSVASL